MKNKYPDFLSFFEYYENFWYPYLENSILDYTKITKLQRCNSYLENYNRIIKASLGNTSKLSLPKFINFLQEQEALYTKKIIEIEKNTSYNGIKIYELLKNVIFNSNIKNNTIDKYNYNPFTIIIIKRPFFKWDNNSCRLDSSFFIFVFVIYGYTNLNDLNKKNFSYLVYNISKYIIKLKENEYKRGIWPIIDKFNNDLKHFILIDNKGEFDTNIMIIMIFIFFKLYYYIYINSININLNIINY